MKTRLLVGLLASLAAIGCGSSIHKAAKSGDEAAVKAAVSPSSIESRDDDKFTPLEVAAGAGQVAVVKLLITKGANVNDHNPRDGGTPLHAAAGAHSNSGEIVRLLVAAGAKPDVQDENGSYTPYLTACSSGNADAMDALLDAGVDPDYEVTVPGGKLGCTGFFAGHGVDEDKVAKMKVVHLAHLGKRIVGQWTNNDDKSVTRVFGADGTGSDTRGDKKCGFRWRAEIGRIIQLEMDTAEGCTPSNKSWISFLAGDRLDMLMFPDKKVAFHFTRQK